MTIRNFVGAAALMIAPLWAGAQNHHPAAALDPATDLLLSRTGPIGHYRLRAFTAESRTALHLLTDTVSCRGRVTASPPLTAHADMVCIVPGGTSNYRITLPNGTGQGAEAFLLMDSVRIPLVIDRD